MQLTSRRRVLAALATGAVAATLAVVASGRGCGALDATPEGAARAFVSAARSRDREAVWALLGPETRRRLHDAAEQATRAVGGMRRYQPLDVLDLGAPDATWAPSGYRVVSRDGREARVEVSGAGGRRDELRLVRVGRAWRVELEIEAQTIEDARK